MRSYGKQISDETVVAKVMRSLTPKFDHVVATIEEENDLSVLSVDKLMGFNLMKQDSIDRWKKLKRRHSK